MLTPKQIPILGAWLLLVERGKPPWVQPPLTFQELPVKALRPQHLARFALERVILSGDGRKVDQLPFPSFVLVEMRVHRVSQSSYKIILVPAGLHDHNKGFAGRQSCHQYLGEPVPKRLPERRGLCLDCILYGIIQDDTATASSYGPTSSYEERRTPLFCL